MLPEAAIRGEDLLRLAMFGHLHFQSLWAGVDLGVFEVLARKGPRTVEELANELDLAPGPMKMVVANLSALGLLEIRGAAFDNSPLARHFLLDSSKHTAVHVIRWQAKIVYPGVEEYVRALRANRNVGLERFSGAGTTLYERLAAHPELERVFQDAMASMPSNSLLLEHLPLDGCHHLCDCGGGNGRNAIELARRHPRLRVTLFDQPSVCARARERIASEGLSDRVSTWDGDFFEDPFPAEIDAVLYSHIAPMWSKKTNVSVFRRVRDALPPGGRLFLYNMVANDDQDGPLEVTCGSVYFHALATGEGFMHSGSEYGAMLAEAGFDDVHALRGLPAFHALIVGTK